MSVKKYFEKRFALVPADKASNNVLDYINVVLKELSTNNRTDPHTYACCSTHVEHLIAEHKNFLTRQNINIDNAAEVLKKKRTKDAEHFDIFDFSTLYTNTRQILA